MQEAARVTPLREQAASRRRWGVLWRRWRGAVYVAPWCVGFIWFTLGPFLFSFYLSFSEWELLGPIEFVGLENYRRLADDPTFVKSLVNTTYYTAISVPGLMLLAFAAALLLNEQIRGRALLTQPYLDRLRRGTQLATNALTVNSSQFALWGNRRLGADELPDPCRRAGGTVG